MEGLVALDEDVAAEARAILANAESLLAGAPTPIDLGVDGAREAARVGAEPPDERAENRVVSACGRDVTVRVFNVGAPDGVYFHIHGGGWNTGGFEFQDARLRRFADACNVAVVSVDYGLAPENPFPGPANDCEVGATWLVENAGRVRHRSIDDRRRVGGRAPVRGHPGSPA